MTRRRWMVAAALASGLCVAACGDLLGIDDFQPPAGPQPPAEDADPEGVGGAGGGGGSDTTTGAPSWAKAYGAAEHDRGRAIAVTADDAVMVSGVIQGRVDFGGGLVGHADGDAVFLTRFDAAGNFVSSTASSGSALLEVGGMAAASTGVVVAGHYSDGDVTFGGETLAAAGSASSHLFVALADANGSFYDAIAFASNGRAELRALAVDASSGEIFIGGIARGAMQFGTIMLDAAPNADAFVAKLAADLTPVWVTSFQAPSDQADQWVSALSLHGGRLYAAGRFAGSVAAGNQLLSSVGAADAFLIELDGAGAAVAASQYGGNGADVDATALVVTDSAVMLAGHFTHSIGVGSDVLESAGDSDMFVAGLSTTGEPQWAASIGGSGSEFVRSMAIDGDGDVVLAGSHSATLDLGVARLESAGNQDALVVKLDARGTPLWAYGFGRNESDAAWDVALDSAGSVLVTGSFVSGLIIDDTMLEAAGSDDVFVAKFGK